MIILDERDKRPIYEQMVDKLSDLIARGILKENDPLPSIRTLAMELSINPNTVARAYSELERKGCIYSVKGRGSFVAETDAVLKQKQNELKAELKTLCKKAEDLGMTKEELVETIKGN